MSLHVENLTVYYQTLRGDVHALESTTFGIADGEIMGLAGESGCGKTTLGQSLTFLHAPMKLIRGRVTLDNEDLPIGEMEKMNDFRFKKISIVPQYAMNAMNPTRKIGKMTAELLRSRNVDFQTLLPELKRRLDLVKLSYDVLNMYPIELSRRYEAENGNGPVYPAEPLAAHRRRNYVGTRCIQPEGCCRDAGGVSEQAILQERHCHHT